MNGEQTAVHVEHRSNGPWPRAWGTPPSTDPARLTGWAKGWIRYGEALRAEGIDVAWLAKLQPHEAHARLKRRAVTPAIAARHRQAQLEHKRAGA